MEIDINNPGIMLFSFNEITALRASEKSRLETLHFLSHDLRAPMNSVLALVQHAKHQDKFDATLLNKIENHVHTNLSYSQQFLQLAKAEEAQPKDFYLCDISEIIDNAIAEIYPTAQAKKITFQKNYFLQGVLTDFTPEDNQSLEVLGDGQLLERMFINLLSNAIKFSASNDIIQIDMSSSSDYSITNVSKPIIHIRISDNGIGIPTEKIPLLFNRFSTSSEKNPQGIGLGLYFVNVVCNRHGGKITAESEPGVGSAFTVHLPSFK